MTDLIKALRKAVLLQMPAANASESSRMIVNRNEALKAESQRLQPLWDKVIAVVEAAEVAEQWYSDEEPWKSLLGNAQKALSDLRLAVGEK